MNSLAITMQHRPDSYVITVAGEMDLDSCPTLEEATLGIPLDGKTLHLEMSGVSFMDSAGLNLLLKLRHRLLAKGSRLLVAGLQDQPTRVLRMTGTEALLTVEAAEAV